MSTDISDQIVVNIDCEINNKRQLDEHIICTCENCKLDDGRDVLLIGIDEKIFHLETHIDEGHQLPPDALSNALLKKGIQDETITAVTVHSALEGDGCGAAVVRFFKNPEDAKAFDRKYGETTDNALSDVCVETNTLYFDKDGVLMNPYIYVPDEDE